MTERQATREQTARKASLYDSLGSVVLALFLAILVWVVATYEADPPKTDLFSGIPIQVRNKAPNLVFMNATGWELEVEIRAPDSSWQELETSSFDAFIDLEGVGEGLSEVPVQVYSPTDPAVTFLDRSPPAVSIRLEEVISKTIRVEPLLLDRDSVPLGFVAGWPTVSPSSVTVSGPRSVVKRAQGATVDIVLDGARETVSLVLAPSVLDAADEPVEGLELVPTEVRAEVQIERQLGYRDVTVRAATANSPASGYWVSSITVEPPTVTVYGKPQIIEALPGLVETNAIDIEGVDETLVKRVPLALPEGVSVYSEDISGQTVNVRIEITPLLGGQTIRRKIEYQGLSAGYQAIVSPEVADVILSGPLPDLQDLDSEDVRVVLDLLGLRLGTHKLQPTVLLPEGSRLAVQTIQPETIEVTIQIPPTEEAPEPPPEEATPTITASATPSETATPTATVEPERGR